MKDGGWGRIVNFGSGSVFQGTAGQSHYAAAKAGVLGLTRSLAWTGWRSALTASCSASRGPRCPLLRRDPGTSRQGRPAAVQLAGTWEDVTARSARTLSRRHAE
jgi:NAD(P)-dependent dehydrogenase (short-subunit alcohol dehydrogenase family)